VRAAGARIQLIPDGDLAAGIATAIPASGIDVLMGVGGSIEGILCAAALQCVGGDMQAQVYLRDADDKRLLEGASFGAVDRVLKIDDLVKGENTMVSATGITDSEVVPGVQFVPGGAVTHSIVMRHKSGTVRFIRAAHRFDRKPVY
jgi:fructose-1,6-bisphosphatase II